MSDDLKSGGCLSNGSFNTDAADPIFQIDEMIYNTSVRHYSQDNKGLQSVPTIYRKQDQHKNVKRLDGPAKSNYRNDSRIRLQPIVRKFRKSRLPAVKDSCSRKTQNSQSVRDIPKTPAYESYSRSKALPTTINEYPKGCTDGFTETVNASKRMDCVKQLMGDTDSVNNRINQRIIRPHKTHGKDDITARFIGGLGTKWEKGCFPTGFGFYLANDQMYSSMKEPELSILYDVILQLEDTEIQGQLLSFLDDFKEKRDFLETSSYTHPSVLMEMSDWMCHAMIDLNEEFTIFIAKMDAAIQAEERVGENCNKFIQSMIELWSLFNLKQIMSSMHLFDWNQSIDLHNCSFTKDIASILDDCKMKRVKSLTIESIESILTEFAKLFMYKQTQIEFLMKTIESKNTAIELLHHKCKMNEELLSKSRFYLIQLEKEVGTLGGKEDTTLKSRKTDLIKRDFFSQTEDGSLSSPLVHASSSLLYDICTDASSDVGKMVSAALATTSSQVTATRGRKKSRKQKPRADANRNMSQRDKQNGQTSEGPKEDLVQVLLMINKFNHEIENRVYSFKNGLLNLHQMEKSEMTFIKEKEHKIESLKSKITSLIVTLQQQIRTIPCIGSDNDKLVIHTPQLQLAHTCVYCSCHICIETSELLDTDQSALSTFTRVLDHLKSSYSGIRNILLDSKTFVTKTFPDSDLFCESNVSMASESYEPSRLSESFIDKCIDRVDSFSTALESARDFTNNFSSITMTFFSVTRNSKARLTRMKTLNAILNKLEQQFEQAGARLHTSVLDVARLRSHSNYLRSGRTLKTLQCPYCQCYTKPFVNPSKDVDVEQTLMQTVGSLKQGFRNVMSCTPDEAKGKLKLISGVSLYTLDILTDVNNLLLKGLQDISKSKQIIEFANRESFASLEQTKHKTDKSV